MGVTVKFTIVSVFDLLVFSLRALDFEADCVTLKCWVLLFDVEFCLGLCAQHYAYRAPDC